MGLDSELWRSQFSSHSWGYVVFVMPLRQFSTVSLSRQSLQLNIDKMCFMRNIGHQYILSREWGTWNFTISAFSPFKKEEDINKCKKIYGFFSKKEIVAMLELNIFFWNLVLVPFVAVHLLNWLYINF